MAEIPTPRIESQIAAHAFIRIIVFLFPVGYAFMTLESFPWPLIPWGILMLYIAIHGAARTLLRPQEEERPTIVRKKELEDE
jgi:hypothetical protein